MIALALRLAARNLRRHRWRTTIVGLGIAIGVAAAVIQGGLVSGIRRQMIEHLVVSEFGHAAILPASNDQAALPLIRDTAPVETLIRETLPGARVVPGLSSLAMAFGVVSGSARVALWGVVPGLEPERVDRLQRRTLRGSGALEAGYVYLGTVLAERLRLDEGDVVTLSVTGPDGDLDAVDFEIARVLGRGAPWQDYFIYLDLDDLRSLMGIGDGAGMLKIRLDSGIRGADAAVTALRGVVGDLRAESFRETGRLYMGIITASRIQAGIVEIVLLLAVALGVAGAQLLAVHERRREIGAMAALGTSRGLIRTIFLAEGAFLSLAAGGVGVVLGAAAVLALRQTGVGMEAEAFHWMVGGTRLVPQVEPRAVVLTLAQLVLIVSLAGLYPAVRASRLAPVEAMR